MTNVGAKTKVELSAVVTRADGMVEDLGVISRGESEGVPDWFKTLQGTDQYKTLDQKGVIENG